MDRVCLLRVVRTTVGVVVALASVTAQSPVPPPTFHAGVDVVPLDVTVLDANRRPVRGLTAADFRVTADGEERPIVAFDAIDLPDRVRAGAPWLTEVTPDVAVNGFEANRIVMLLLDDWNTAPQAAAAISVRKVGQAVIDGLHPSDLVAVIYPFQTQRGVEFTTDRAKLRDAVQRFTVGRPPLPGDSGACLRQHCVLGAMRAISEAAMLWPDRRKLLVFVSPEFSGGGGDSTVDYGQMSLAVMNTFKDLQRSNVTVYQYDPRGIEETGGVDMPGMFADHTGGRTVTRTNDPWLRVPEMFAENDSYYVLGFTPSTRPSRAGFHPIRVRVTRPGLTVVARRDYYAPGPKAEATAAKAVTADGETVLDRAMFGLVPKADLPIRLTAAPFRVPGTRRVAVSVAAGFDRAKDQLGADTVDVAVRAFDQTKQLRNSLGHWTSTHRVAAGPAGSSSFDALTRIELPPGSYELRLSMQRDSDQVAGGVAMFLTVPNFESERLSLSGVVLGPAAAPVPIDTGLADVLPFPPTTARTFGSGESVTALVRVYQGGRDQPRPATLAARIVNASDRSVFERTTALAPTDFGGATRSAEYRLTLPLAGLAAGEYLLTFEARLDGRKDMVLRQVQFHVR